MERFWAKVEKDLAADGCWEFVGASGKVSSVYPRFRYKGKTIQAHRFSWMLAHGEIPAGMYVCHRCTTRDAFTLTIYFWERRLTTCETWRKRGERLRLTEGLGVGWRS